MGTGGGGKERERGREAERFSCWCLVPSQLVQTTEDERESGSRECVCA